MGTPQARLKEFILHKFPTIQAFAKELGISNANLYKYLKDHGSVFKTEAYTDKLKNLGLNTAWYLNGEGEMLLNSSSKEEDTAEFKILGDELILITQSDMVEIPLIDSAFPCGVPQTNEGLIKKVSVRKRYVEGMKDPYLIKCVGDSMNPDIKDGDELIVETVNGDLTKIKNRAVVVACINNEHTIKRLYFQDGSYMLIPDNHKGGYAPYILKPGDEMMIIAVAKKVIHNIDC